jgi:hypothetical protein
MRIVADVLRGFGTFGVFCASVLIAGIVLSPDARGQNPAPGDCYYFTQNSKCELHPYKPDECPCPACPEPQVCKCKAVQNDVTQIWSCECVYVAP